jgi:hypothetical protein
MVECPYCGGRCPDEPADSPHLCDGFAGDIDGLSAREDDKLNDDRDPESPFEFSEKMDWSKWDFDSDPDWR